MGQVAAVGLQDSICFHARDMGPNIPIFCVRMAGIIGVQPLFPCLRELTILNNHLTNRMKLVAANWSAVRGELGSDRRENNRPKPDRSLAKESSGHTQSSPHDKALANRRDKGRGS
jgi:hypothetical protein